MRRRLRFAPSPSGGLHVGNARTALFNWLFARGGDGDFILRIENTDVERSTEASERSIVDDLRWMGLDWTEGVVAGGDHGPYRQSERLHIYRAHVVELMSRSRAYRCFCSAEQLETDRAAAFAEGRPPKYVGRCRDLPAEQARQRVQDGEQAVIRLRVPQDREITFHDLVRGEVRVHADSIGDAVLVRSNGTPAYNFAAVIDDALMEVTHVIRGEDHISNTPLQMLLYEAFGWTPPTFAHVPFVMGVDQTPLSKRRGAASVADLRARGYLPEAVTNYLALLGWSPGEGEELLPLEELARRFRLDRVGRSAGNPRRGEAGVGESTLSEAGTASAVGDVGGPVLSARRLAGRADASGPGVPRAGRPGCCGIGRSAGADAIPPGISLCVLGCRGDA